LSDNFELIPGDANSTIQALFTNASQNDVQVRAMLWDQAGTQNTAEVGRINALANGAAILDNRTLNLGSHHQKILIVKGSEGLITFCGGVDINDDRISAVARQAGSPMHDVHCKIRGPAAFDLLQIFVQRWLDHPDHTALDTAKGALRGLTEPVPSPIAGRNHFVQIGRTYGNGNRHRGIDSDRFGTRPRGYAFAPDGEQTARRLIFKAIREARRFIYIEDQYLVSMNASRELQAALPNIQHLTILIPQGSISDLPQAHFRRREFIAPLRAAGGAKVRVFFLSPAGGNHSYVHAKMYVIDDQFAIIGSANCNRRGFTHDSEVVAGIFDPSQDDALAHHFAHQLRIRLWAEHLNMNTSTGHAQLNDGVASAVHWLHPPAGAHIAPYDETINIERVHTDTAWDAAEDPDGS
jgi:phosphatidylserine/phosphatidylglycerophosphate/cardiolipin synthase-like enzyme